MATPEQLSTPENPEPASEPDSGTASETFDLHDLIVSLDPDIQGKLEPLSGLLMLNVSHAEYLEAFQRFASNASTEDDRDLIGTINHETYHGLQAAASGYSFDRQSRQFAVLNAVEPTPELPFSADVRTLLDTMHTEAGDDPQLKLRADRAQAIIRSEYAIQYFDAVAMPGDNSIFGAMHPAFFRFQAQLAQKEALVNPDGLSIAGILEGSAVAFAHQVMRPGGGAEQAMLAEFATLPPLYRQLYDLTLAHAPSRALELLLPATALALSYAEPHNAYLPLLHMLAASPPGQALASGQAIAAGMPAIPGAGAILGTALDRRRADDSYRIYDTFLEALGAPRWPFDAYGLLADPANMNIIDTFPFSIVTADGFQRLPNAMTFPEFAARMYLLSLVMRKFSRRLEELRLRDLQAQWASDVLHNFADNLPPV